MAWSLCEENEADHYLGDDVQQLGLWLLPAPTAGQEASGHQMDIQQGARVCTHKHASFKTSTMETGFMPSKHISFTG